MPANSMAPALITAWTAVARNSGETRSATGRQLLHHAYFHAPLRGTLQLDVVHEAPHEEDAAPARFEHVLGREGVGHFLWLEPFALVGDLDHELRRRVDRSKSEFDGDQLAPILT